MAAGAGGGCVAGSGAPERDGVVLWECVVSVGRRWLVRADGGRIGCESLRGTDLRMVENMTADYFVLCKLRVQTVGLLGGCAW